MMRSMSLALKGGDNITLSGFGTFSVYHRKARNGRNPQTGELIKIKTRRVAKFSAGIDLKKALARSG
jgi:DNA-binding protein HU-beta